MFDNFIYKVKQTIYVWWPNSREKAINKQGQMLANNLFGGEFKRASVKERPQYIHFMISWY